MVGVLPGGRYAAFGNGADGGGGGVCADCGAAGLEAGETAGLEEVGI